MGNEEKVCKLSGEGRKEGEREGEWKSEKETVGEGNRGGHQGEA